ncbi:hypothetical protein [Stenotrophomonas maltophilia]|uniref:hypothetical protein n=1 Tax=Stenotrophomonas maltophilia TaxID=40324 RepID=UPI00115EFE3A|nr:hypothetical protein [Stenotrophomonas maltophilia]
MIVIQAVSGWLIFKFGSGWDTRGQFGDMFGAVNTLFSGLAFASLIFALSLQRKDLALQRTELQMTRVELERSASAQTTSASVAERMEREQRLSMEITILSNKIQATAALNQAFISFLPKASYHAPSSGGDSEAVTLQARIRRFNKEMQDDHNRLCSLIDAREMRAKEATASSNTESAVS